MSRILLPLAALLAPLAPAATAQAPCHAENDGPTHDYWASSQTVGVRFVAPADFDCLAIEVFTGDGQGTASVAIWSHDPIDNEPDTPLGVGSWPLNLHLIWQGASLGGAVPLVAGGVYWMVFSPPGFDLISVDLPSPNPNQLHRHSADDGQTWGQASEIYDWKFRLYGDCDGIGAAACFGSGLYAPCPCGNADPTGSAGCENSSGAGCRLSGSGSSSVAGADLVLRATEALPNQPGVFFQGDELVGGGSGSPFGDGLRCAGTGVVRLELSVPDAGGVAMSTVGVAATGGAAPGDLRHYQFWYRDPSGGPCGSGFNLSNALSIPWAP